jgi:hypothetical protein
LVLSKAVLSFIVIEISADVHRAVFASARPNQHLESWEAREAPSKIKIKRLLKREIYPYKMFPNSEHFQHVRICSLSVRAYAACFVLSWNVVGELKQTIHIN